MTSGVLLMLVWPADNWDSPDTVGFFFQHVQCILLNFILQKSLSAYGSPPYYLSIYARGKVIGCVHLSLSVCLSAQKCQFSRSSCCISAKYLQTVLNFEKLPCLCFFLLDTLYKCLKSCIWSWHYGHAYQPHPDTWPCVNIHIGTCRAMWVPGQDLAMPHLMRNCGKRIQSLHCTLYVHLRNNPGLQVPTNIQ